MVISVSPVLLLRGSLELPPDKSIAQRAALFSLLCKSQSVIENYPLAEDPQTALSCIQQLGAKVSRKGTTVTVEGVGREGLKVSSKEIYCGNSGTVMRLLSGMIAGSGVTTLLTGDASLSSRPMKRIIEPLSLMGAEIKAQNGQYPPLAMSRNQALKGITFPLPVASAQLKSCVLLAGLFGEEKTRVIEAVPSRNHTETMLRLPVYQDHSNSIIESSRDIAIMPQTITIPGDFSAAAFWMVGATILEGSRIYLPGTGVNPTRRAALDILLRMGANITVENQREEGGEPVADITVCSASLKPVQVMPSEIPNAIDELPVLAIAMAFADGVSEISGAEELRYKESDRLAAMEQLLQNAGVTFERKQDGLIIFGDPGRKSRPARYDSLNDHRIAMSAAILSLKSDGVSEIHNAEAASVSYPDFWDHVDKLSH